MRSGDEDEEFEGWDVNSISGPFEALKNIPLASMPEHVYVEVDDNDFPKVRITNSGTKLRCAFKDKVDSNCWVHKYSVQAFAEAMGRAVRRLISEGHPFSDLSIDDEILHVVVRWSLQLQRDMQVADIFASIRAAYDLVCVRANSILENSDSVLVLGKDAGVSLLLLQRIADRLQDLGYYTFIIKEQPDRLGESVIQKVMKYALTAKFVIVENTEASGHLYELPHVMKSAECVTVVLQEDGKGATWMFEDGYAKHRHWHKIMYQPESLENAVDAAAEWAEKFVKDFGDYQKKVLPWMKPQTSP